MYSESAPLLALAIRVFERRQPISMPVFEEFGPGRKQFELGVGASVCRRPLVIGRRSCGKVEESRSARWLGSRGPDEAWGSAERWVCRGAAFLEPRISRMVLPICGSRRQQCERILFRLRVPLALPIMNEDEAKANGYAR